MNTAGVAASSRTRRPEYTPPQQPQRCRPGTAAKAAGIAHMPLMVWLNRSVANRRGMDG
jgi:hypothetical protein